MRPLWRKVAGWVVGILLIFSQAVDAAEWSMEPTMSLTGEYDDNLLLGTDRKAVVGSTLSPGLKVSAVTEQLELRGSILLNITRYLNESDLNATDQYYRIFSRYLTEKSVWELEGSYTRDLTLISELMETGVVLARKRRDLLTLDPKWRGSLTEKISIEADYLFSDAEYADPSLVNYQTQQGTAQVLYQLAEYDQVSVASYYMIYRAPSVNSRSNEYGIRAGVTHRFSETFKGNLSAGIRNTKSSFQTLSSEQHASNLGWIAEGNLEKEFETSLVRGGFSRETRPSGGGYLVDVSHLSFFISKKMTTALTASLILDFYLSLPLPTNLSVQDSRYYRIEQRWDWQWAEHWFLGVSYRYARQEIENTSEEPYSNAVYLIVTYNGPKISISR